MVLQLVVGKKQQQGDEVLPRKAPSPVEEEEKREVPLEEEEEIQQTVKLREKDFNPTIGTYSSNNTAVNFGGFFADNCSSFSMHTDITRAQSKVGMHDVHSLLTQLHETSTN